MPRPDAPADTLASRPDGPPDTLANLRWLVLACQTATIVGSWPLWQVRPTPPLLPLLDLPQVHLGAALLASLALALWRPLPGAAVHSALLVVAVVLDRTREQPQLFSLALLLWATVPRAGCAFVGRAHICVLWLASGLGKLAHPRFHDEGGRWLLGLGETPAAPGVAAALGLGVLEVALGVAVLCRRTRAWAAAAGLALHLAIAGVLVVRGENPSVWWWNVALGWSVWCLWRLPGRAAAPRWAVAAAAGLALLPFAYELRLVPASVSHQLYACSEPRATWLRADGSAVVLGESWELGVQLPASAGFYRQWFARVAGPGDVLVLQDDRWLTKWLGPTTMTIPHPGVRR